MKALLLVLAMLAAGAVASAQISSSAVHVVTVYSQNEQFHLKTVPHDNISPTSRGKTYVYEKGKSTPLYTLDRGFDTDDHNRLILSNNGDVIFHLIAWYANEKTDGLKSVNIYKEGKLLKS